MKNSLGWLKTFLWFVCAFHVLVGLSLNLDLGFKQWVASSLYSASVNWSDGQFTYILKPLGVFMIALGVMAAFAARDPLRHRSVIIGFAILFTMRGLQRVLFMDEITRVFAIGAGRSLAQMVVMLGLALALVLLLRVASAGTQRGGMAPA
jgi:hypothetical protein